MKTIYEKDDVSQFRKYVREKRFQKPIYEEKLQSLLKRLENLEEPPILLVTARGRKSTNGEPDDAVGIGKTDFCYFATNFFRQTNPKIKVLSFPDIADEVERGTTFYSSVFIPEVLRLTQTYSDKFLYFLNLVKTFLLSILKRFLLLVRVNVLLAVALFAFVFATVSLDFIYEHQTELTEVLSKISIPVILVAIILWGVYVWDRVEKEYSAQWRDSAFKNLLTIDKAENIYIPPEQVVARFNTRDKIILIVDDANRIDTESLSRLMAVVPNYQAKEKKRSFPRIALVLLSDELKETQNNQQIPTAHLSDFRRRLNHWLNIDIYPPTIDEIGWLLGGIYKGKNAWNLVAQLIDSVPEINQNIGLLLQFLYDETKILEDENKTLDDINLEQFLNDYQTFINDYDLQAERILGRILDESRELAKEFIKYILAFESPLPNIEKIHSLMEMGGFQNIKSTAEILIQKKLIKIHDGSYIFYSLAERNILLLSWSEWRNGASSYYSKVFDFLHESSSARDNPLLAKRCEPSRLVVDVLWREGDALWFFGGNADVHTALSYYGLEVGALGKWVQVFENDIRKNALSKENYMWRVTAKNSPFRYKSTSRSPRSESFIGDLFQISAALYFIAGDYDKSFYILGDLWGKVSNAYWNMSDLNETVNEKMRDTENKIKIQLSFYLLLGPSKKENIAKAKELLTLAAKANMSLQDKILIDALVWRTNYFANYAVGNLLHGLWLIRTPDINPEIPEFDQNKSALGSLFVLPLRVSHLLDYLNWVRNQPDKRISINSILDEINVLLDALEKSIRIFEKNVNDSLKNPYPLIRGASFPLPDADITILILKGWLQYYKAQVLFFEFSPKLENRKMPFKLDELGGSIRHFYDVGMGILEHNKSENIFTTRLTELKNQCQTLYSQYLNSDKPKRDEIQKIHQGIEKSAHEILSESQTARLNGASDIFRLASDVSSMRLVAYEEVLAIYSWLSVGSRNARSINTPITELLERAQVISPKHIQGNGLDSLAFYIRVAQMFNEFYFEYAYGYFDQARIISDSLADCLPSIVKGRIIGLQLDLLGNVGEFKPPDEIIYLANQALEIYNNYSGEAISQEDLELLKGGTRWWIAEACARLANKHHDNVEAYYKTAKQNLNWIERQSKDNPSLKKMFLPKNNQVDAHFLRLQKRYRDAIARLQAALPEFEGNLFEQIQTLDSIVSTYLALIISLGRNADKKIADGFSGSMHNLRSRLLQSRALHQSTNQVDLLYRKTAEACILYGQITWQTGAREQEQIAKEALDLWVYGIKGLIDWRLAGRAAIELSNLRNLSIQVSSFFLPAEFNGLVKRCVDEWDPRRELTDRIAVQKALRDLVGEKIEVKAVLSETTDKSELISRCHMLLARPNPDLPNIYDTLKNALDQIDADDPTSEDIDLVRLLIECSSIEKDYEKIKEIQKLFKDLSLTYASKVYLDIARAFSTSPDIQERYLRMAVSMGQNKFSAEASRLISQLVNKTGVRKSDFTKDETEKINYKRLMNLPDSEYDVSEAFNLLFLFENELRRLIAYQFDKRDGWWKKGIPSDMYERVSKESKERLKGVELLKMLTLGDLFKIIKFGDNWEQIFKTIFLSISNVESREGIILPFRNKLAHTNPDITQNELKEFVAVTKSIISRIQPYLPE
jgi:hypothetical protein